MRQSHLFTKTRKEVPADETSKNAQLLLRAGYVYKEMAGVYALLPLGLKVFNNIISIIRDEMNKIGGQEVTLTALQSPETWTATGRFDDEAVDVWFKTKLKGGTELGLAPTHEEPLTKLMTTYVNSYKDLPRYVYQFQTKFRNELRAKSGIMRTREFVMKDMYSFNTDEASFREFYEASARAYLNVFARAGLGAVTYRTFASGGSFSKFSDEFQTVCDAGEDIVYVDESKHIAVNKEVYTDEVLNELHLSKETLVEKKSIEVGNIFPLGTRFSDALGLVYKNADGKPVPVVMGSYGIGPARLMGTIVEVLSDDKGIVWPYEVAPFKAHLVLIDGKDENIRKDADALYDVLQKQGIEVLYDDRADVSAGEKFKDADLLGMPWRIVISARTVAAGQLECVKRSTGETFAVNESDLVKTISA